MKNVLNLILFCILFSNHSFAGPPWWKTALVDAGAGLFGVSEVLGHTGGIAGTTPLGWVACGVGGVISGAAGSISYAGIVAPNGNGPTIFNPNNPFDNMGKNHNLIVRDYFNSGQIYTNQQFLNFIDVNKNAYNISENIYITLNVLETERNLINNLKNDDQYIGWITDKLPADVNKVDFNNFLNSLSIQQNKDAAVSSIINFENKIYNDGSISTNSKNYIFICLAILRNSTALWFK